MITRRIAFFVTTGYLVDIEGIDEDDIEEKAAAMSYEEVEEASAEQMESAISEFEFTEEDEECL